MSELNVRDSVKRSYMNLCIFCAWPVDHNLHACIRQPKEWWVCVFLINLQAFLFFQSNYFILTRNPFLRIPFIWHAIIRSHSQCFVFRCIRVHLKMSYFMLLAPSIDRLSFTRPRSIISKRGYWISRAKASRKIDVVAVDFNGPYRSDPSSQFNI